MTVVELSKFVGMEREKLFEVRLNEVILRLYMEDGGVFEISEGPAGRIDVRAIEGGALGIEPRGSNLIWIGAMERREG